MTYPGYRNKEARKEYMRLYMRKKRSQESRKRDAQIEKMKLECVEKLLISKYSSEGFKPESVNLKKKLVWRSPTGAVLTISFKPSLKRKAVEVVGEGKITRGPSVPESWTPYIRSVLERIKKYDTVTLPETFVVQEFKRYMDHDLSELIAERWHARFLLLGERLHVSSYAKREWFKMRKDQEASEQALTDFALVAIVDRKTDAQILREAKTNKATRRFFKYHGPHDLAETHAKHIIEFVRGCLS